MKRSLISFLTILSVAVAFGLATRRTASASSTITLYAQLTAAAETPAGSAADSSGNGLATITLNVQTDYYGMVTGASANFDVTVGGFPTGDQIVAAHIHTGDVGVAGAVVVDTMVGMQPFANGAATLHLPNISVSPSMATQIMANPGAFYFNVHTLMSEAGAIRGQLSTTKPTPQTTQTQKTFVAQLKPSNEVPAVTNADSTGSGEGTVVLHLTEDSTNTIVSATADFSFNMSNMPSTDQIILAHIHTGAAGANGGVVISSGISPGTAIALTGGSATFSTTGISVDAATAQQIVSNPAGFYFNVHTNLNQGGAARGQLEPQASQNSTVTLGAPLSPANEVPPITGAEASAKGQGNVVLHLTEDQTGTVTAATADFSFSVSGLPSGDQLILAHVHMGAKGANGGVVISSGISPGSPISLTGGGATFSTTGITVDPATAMAIAATPANFYFNVHSTTSPGGVMRGQLETPPTVASASITGKRLTVIGTGFVKGDTILVNGNAVATKFQSATQLLAKKGGKGVASGQTITVQVQQADGLVTATLMFTKP